VEETLAGKSCDECRNFHSYPGPLANRGDTQIQYTTSLSQIENEASDRHNADGSHGRLPGVGIRTLQVKPQKEKEKKNRAQQINTKSFESPCPPGLELGPDVVDQKRLNPKALLHTGDEEQSIRFPVHL
jgi:hypothetical protein